MVREMEHVEANDDAPVKEVLVAGCGELPEGALEEPVNGQVQSSISPPPRFMSGAIWVAYQRNVCTV